MKDDFLISIVVPVMNEEDNIPLLYKELERVLNSYSDFEIIFIDDGSVDNTLQKLKMLHLENNKVKYFSFSRNFGHQNALKAGLDNALGDCVISLDGDLQHPTSLIPELINNWQKGYEIVYTIREEDPNLSFWKKISSRLFYKLMNSLTHVEIEQGSADFRLLDRSVVDVIKRIKETPLFYRGIVSWLGFKQIGIKYKPSERLHGTTKYSFVKMMSLGMAGITGFSVKPLHLSTKIGFIFAILAFVYSIYALYIKLFTNSSIDGWASLLIVVSLIGGIQLISIGILGEYIGKLFMQEKKRPAYIIREKSTDSKHNSKLDTP